MKNVNKEELLQIVDSAECIADICRAIDLVPSGDNYARVRRLLELNEITWNKEYSPWNKGIKYKTKQYSLEDILSNKIYYSNINRLRSRLIKNGYKENKCEVCGLSGEEVSLELRHIDGNHSNNKLENLQILCPNCHSKTPNYRGKNMACIKQKHIAGSELREKRQLSEEEIKQRDLEKRAKKAGKTVEQYLLDKQKSKRILKEKICPLCSKSFQPSEANQRFCSIECYHNYLSKDRPSLTELINSFNQLHSFVQVGKFYGVSDNAVRKWCKLYKIPFKTKELKEYLENFNKGIYKEIECSSQAKKEINHTKIINDYLSGLSTSKVAELNNCNETTVRNILNENNIERHKKEIVVNQYTLEGKLNNQFNNMSEAVGWVIKNVDNVTLNTTTIRGFLRDCCNGKRKTAYGYIWKYL